MWHHTHTKKAEGTATTAALPQSDACVAALKVGERVCPLEMLQRNNRPPPLLARMTRSRCPRSSSSAHLFPFLFRTATRNSVLPRAVEIVHCSSSALTARTRTTPNSTLRARARIGKLAQNLCTSPASTITHNHTQTRTHKDTLIGKQRKRRTALTGPFLFLSSASTREGPAKLPTPSLPPPQTTLTRCAHPRTPSPHASTSLLGWIATLASFFIFLFCAAFFPFFFAAPLPVTCTLLSTPPLVPSFSHGAPRSLLLRPPPTYTHLCTATLFASLRLGLV